MFAKILKSLSQGRRQRLDYIDALKGVCILFVVITHMKWSDADSNCNFCLKFRALV